VILHSFLEEKDELIFVISLPKMTRRTALNLISMFGTPAGVIEAISKCRVPSAFSQNLSEWLNAARKYRSGDSLSALKSKGIGAVVLGEDSYPKLLSELTDPPLILFFRGTLPASDSICIAVVGSRNPTPYGMEVSRKLGRELAGAGICVVSGAALGIDSAAHAGALESRGFTVAVLGCGVDVVYPPVNRLLLADISKRGCLISEYPPGTKPEKFRFPERNRIIAGMCTGVVVVEAGKTSGALITAEFALSENREVFAVPGPIFSPKSAGTNLMIKSGAVPVTCTEDVLEGVGFSPNWVNLQGTVGLATKISSLSEKELMVVEAIKAGYMYPEEISSVSSIESRLVLSILSQLEVKGVVIRSGAGAYFARI